MAVGDGMGGAVLGEGELGGGVEGVELEGECALVGKELGLALGGVDGEGGLFGGGFCGGGPDLGDGGEGGGAV